MRKYFLYLIIYSIGGFILERIINLIALGYWYDNSILVGPWQPLYGMGILMAIIIYDIFLKHFEKKWIRYSLLLIVSILTTGISEAVTGFGYEFLYEVRLWDYGLFFTCSVPYVCAIPTSLFGVFSFLVIVLVHPFIRKIINTFPGFIRRWLFRIAMLLFVIDIVYTFGFRLA